MADGHHDFELAPEVVHQARQAGIIGNVERRVRRMAKFAAPFRHPHGNRRYESFILRVEKGVVTSFCRFNAQTGEVIHDVLGQLEERHRERQLAEQAQATQAAADRHLEGLDSEPAATPRAKSRGGRKKAR
jgi:hypothetical protein